MMAPTHTIEIPLPEGLQPTSHDLELLKATFQAIASLRCESGSEWEKIFHQLEADGWKVTWGLTWIAEAKRGEDYEQVRGATLDEAFAELAENTRIAEVGGCP
jgi:hypothetical protein